MSSSSGLVTGLKRSEAVELARLLEELKTRRGRLTVRNYKPYKPQAEFHDAGRTHRERLFLAGNQQGKTISAGCEFGAHLTGIYPEWWTGRRFDAPIVMWASGITSESTRDNPQRVLLGEGTSFGTGVIPGDMIDLSSIAMRRGVAFAVDGVNIKHVSGGYSRLYFKSYDQGRERWQGPTLSALWFDEEPPVDIYSEGLTRTNATGGMVAITATPLLGMTDVIGRFYPKPNTPERHLTQMTITDAAHYSPEEVEKIIASYPPHEREARARGIPMLGSGRIYPVADEVIAFDPIVIPEWWPQIGAIDFGWDHPTAAVRIALDRESDVAYVTHTYRKAEAMPLIHAEALKGWGEKLPFCWPHDGQNETAAGESLYKQYQRHGLQMLDERASYQDDRKSSVEAGLMDILERMQTGRLKVFNHLTDFFDEFRQYHRKDGKIVKVRDDLMDALRYGIMMLRFARIQRGHRKIRTWKNRTAGAVSALAG